MLKKESSSSSYQAQVHVALKLSPSWTRTDAETPVTKLIRILDL